MLFSFQRSMKQPQFHDETESFILPANRPTCQDLSSEFSRAGRQSQRPGKLFRLPHIVNIKMHTPLKKISGIVQQRNPGETTIFPSADQQ